MRTIIVFGLLALFVAVSFVPPNGMPNTAVAQAQAISIDFNVNLNDAIHAVKTQATAVVRQVPNVDVTIPLELPNTNSVVKEAAPSFLKRLFSVAVDTATDAIQSTTVTDWNWKRVAENEPNETLRQHFLLVEWAREKSDIRACGELSPTVLEERESNGRTYMTPSRGDWVAYCLARVTKNSDRCKQIQTTILPPLKSLCEQEFQ